MNCLYDQRSYLESDLYFPQLFVSKHTCKDSYVSGLFFVSIVKISRDYFLDVFVIRFFVVAKEDIAERSCIVSDISFVVDDAEDRG